MIAEDKKVFTIGETANMLGLHPKTLRHYEKENLIRPLRKGNWRYFAMEDIKWIGCLRDMMHEQGLSFAAIKKLLHYTPCWNIADCSFEKRKLCTAFMASGLVPRRIVTVSPQQTAGCRIIPFPQSENRNAAAKEKRDSRMAG